MIGATRSLTIIILFCAFVNSEYITKKICKDEDSSQCIVNSVKIDPCPEGPNFCGAKRYKAYTATVDFVPHFAAKTVQVAMYADEEDSGNFNETVRVVGEGCHLTPCPIEAELRRVINVDFVFNKDVSVGKFPVKLKLWNIEDVTQSCCFTFKVKLHK